MFSSVYNINQGNQGNFVLLPNSVTTIDSVTPADKNTFPNAFGSKSSCPDSDEDGWQADGSDNEHDCKHDLSSSSHGASIKKVASRRHFRRFTGRRLPIVALSGQEGNANSSNLSITSVRRQSSSGGSDVSDTEASSNIQDEDTDSIFISDTDSSNVGDEDTDSIFISDEDEEEDYYIEIGIFQ